MNAIHGISRFMDSALVYGFTALVGRNSSAHYWLYQYWEDAADPRTADYFMVNISSLGIAAFFAAYIFLVTVFIPFVMRRQKPFSLHKTIIAYDVILVIINTYFFYKVIRITNFGREMWNFTNPKLDTSPAARQFIDTAHLYYLSKILDMADTFFMALRKKNSHISVLHVWHHFSLPGAGWLFMKYNPYQPTIAIIPMINCIIHVIMYGYYALAALGPEYQKYLWWKRYITQLQLIQFVIVWSWYMIVYFKQTDMPVGYLWCNLGNAMFLFSLFFHFYITSYRRARHAKTH